MYVILKYFSICALSRLCSLTHKATVIVVSDLEADSPELEIRIPYGRVDNENLNIYAKSIPILKSYYTIRSQLFILDSVRVITSCKCYTCSLFLLSVLVSTDYGAGIIIFSIP
jgi:hypothetical protein